MMVIKQGEWNYYVSFQLNNGWKSINRCIELNRFEKYALAMHQDGQSVTNIAFTESENELIKAYIDKYLPLISQTGNGIDQLYSPHIDEHPVVLLIGPLIMRTGEEFVLCPVQMYLSETGFGMVKISAPLDDIPAERFSATPLLKWFDDISLVVNCGGICEKACDGDYATVAEITELIRDMLAEIFSGFLVNEKRNICFETLLLYQTEKPSLRRLMETGRYWEKLYHLCYPENFMEHPDEKKLAEFRENKVVNIGGITFIKSTPGRLIILGNAEEFRDRLSEDRDVDPILYFSNSLQLTYDWAICVGIWKHTNELNFFNYVADNLHAFNSNKFVYNAVANRLDSIMGVNNPNPKRIVALVYDNLDAVMEPNRDRLERISQIEGYLSDKYEQRKNLILETVALMATVIFGLPAIRDTILILRSGFWHEAHEISQYVTVTVVAVFIWGLAIIFIGYVLWRNYKKYREYRI